MNTGLAGGGSAVQEPVSDVTLRTTRTILVLAVTEVIGKLSTLVLVVGAARLLGVADFGVFSYALAVGALVAVVPLWAYDTTLVQRASAEPARLGALFAALLAMRTALVVLVFLIVGGVAGLTSPSSGQNVAAGLLVIAATLLDSCTETYRSVAAAIERQSIIAVVHLVQRLLTAAGALVALLAHTGLLGLSVAYFAGTVVGPVLASLMVRRAGVRPDWRALSRTALVNLNRGTWVIGLSYVVLIALFRLDTVMLAWFAGERAVGIYAAAYRLLETAVFVCWVVTRAIFPKMAADPGPGRVQRLTEQGFGVLAAVFVPYMTVLLCRGHDILRVLYGAEFADAGTDMLRWLAPAPLLFGLAFLASFAILAAGPTVRVLVSSVIALASNVGLNLVLIPRYGGVAAAFTTSLCYAIQAFLLIALGRARAGRPRVLRAALPAMAASAASAGPLLAPWPLLPALCTAAVLYLPCWALTARYVDPKQVRVLRGMLTWRRTA